MPSFDGVESNSFSSMQPAEAPVGIWQHGASTSNPLVIRNAQGQIIGGLPTPGAAPVQAIVDASVISVGTLKKHWTLIPITTGAAKTGVIMSTGLYDGQMVIIVNRDTTKTNSITFDATEATSLVAGSNEPVIAGGQGCVLIWDAGSGRWYETKHAAAEA